MLAAGANAFLAGGGLVIISFFEAEEHILELVHPCVGEKQRGIVHGDERTRPNNAVAALLEKSQESFPDFVARQIVHKTSVEATHYVRGIVGPQRIGRGLATETQ